ncbi:hypothetical protein UFOVP724_135 [uncultured Caudovirales phage]|uniref:DUF559 domain-containing protein n=1 Tax=uncultured Caudovirales phage TaxID=2100421 RepID=A0A6J5NSK7_9CAUD|nr:hypothetical protein UFOVP724_135 [uncultured Caudovirales phage]
MVLGKGSWKNQFFLYENASDFHNKVREIFCTDVYFKQLQCFQEVPMSSLVLDYPNNNDAVDWYIESLRLVIELHGEQHYRPVSFSNQSYAEKMTSYHNIVYRDNRKKTYLLDNGYMYIEIPYKLKSKLTAEMLKNLIYEYGDEDG